MSLAIITDPSKLPEVVNQQKAAGRQVGLVPTMGALHAGHLSLVEQSTLGTDFTVVTIFVNPTQFAPTEDLDQYPRDLQRDVELLSGYGVDVVFAPSVNSMYPAGASTSIVPPEVARPLEGELRPGHFEGVATIVLKLFNLVPADVAFFGQKDFQQTRVIADMIRDLNIPIDMKVCPIVREADGLALSSRNAYLTPEQRQQATALSQSLFHIKTLVAEGQTNASELLQAALQILADAAIGQIDYVALVDPQTLTPVTQVSDNTIALAAVYVGSTRLIDNLFLN